MVNECPRCALGDHTRSRREDGIRHRATEPRPSMDELEQMVFDGIAEATDGCRIEPDGICEHGHASWLIALGIC